MEILSSSKLAFINREGERIQNDLAKIIESFPNFARTITGMSRWLKANKSTCQRMVEAVINANDGLQVIKLLPGPSGILKYIDLASQQKVNKKLISKAQNSVVRFENLIYEFSRSHSALKKLIENSTNKDVGKVNKNQKRKELFQVAKELTGESIETEFKFFILKDNEEDNSYLQQLTFSYIENYQLSGESRPMLFMVTPFDGSVEINTPTIMGGQQKPEGEIPTFALIEELTSQEVLNNAEDSIFGDSWIVIPTDPKPTTTVNIGFIKNYPHEQLGPFHGGKNASCTSVMVRSPTKKLHMVCFLDRKYAMRSVADIGIYSTNTDLVHRISSPESLWFDRFQDDVGLSLYNSNINFSEKLDFPKANDLVDSFFHLSGCNKEDYSCFLVTVDYPLWSSHYRMYFQYAID